MGSRTAFLAPLLAVLACGGGGGSDLGIDAAADAPASDLPREDARPDVGACVDADGDGHAALACGGDDCDDANPRRYPGATEVCDAAGLDEDCNPATLGPDADGDGEPSVLCCNGATCGRDCDDHRATVGPTAVESCNGVDDDCDGMVDEGVTTTFCFDTDGDGHGDLATATTGCAIPLGATTTCNDCDDGDPMRHPGATETCDGLDHDCNRADDDRCPCLPVGDVRACGDAVGACTTGTQTCLATTGWAAVCAGAVLPTTESCNGVDDDCDGVVDEGLTYVFYADCDGDGYGDDTTAMSRCIAPVGVPPGCTRGLWAMTGGDCDDTNASVNPSAGCPPPATGPDAGMPTCLPPLVDCDGLPGCEANLSTSATSCGACGFACLRAGGCAHSTCLGDFVQLAAGDASVSALRGNGEVWFWGSNQLGQIGFGAIGGNYPLALATMVPSDAGIVQLTSGYDITCGVTTAGDLWCFGNDLGDFGDGITGPDLTKHITTVTGVASLDAGERFTCAVMTDATASCWGRNGEQQLGDGTTTDHPAPVPVIGLPAAPARVLEVDAGWYVACARIDDGSVWCWGLNNAGQLGRGTTGGGSGVPMAVGGVAGAASVSVGQYHACARLGTGEVLCWGEGTHGELGDGLSTSSATPVAVVGLPAVVEIGCGTGFTCARTAGGDVWCWGANDTGQTGDTGATSPAPHLVAVGNAAQLAVGGAFACVLRDSHEVQCWGDRTYGQLDDGMLGGFHATPAPISDP